ncbi:MAG: hypothetical protein CSA96_06045 [Bacteroidetes bacterium]|nr:MAG: hypothetical protein CSA96_06045 [Bacteroidota bacterium]
MREGRKLLEYKDLQVHVETTPNTELKEHLYSTVLGTPGGLRYIHCSLEDRLHAPGENYFMYLHKQDKMLGSVGFVGRHTETAGVRHDSWLIRYFSIKAPMRSVPKAERKKNSADTREGRPTVLGRFVKPIFKEPSQLRPDEDEQGPAIIYAFIEEKNIQSYNFSVQMGMECLGEAVGFPFSRLWPKHSARIERLPREEEQDMLALIRDFYSDHVLFVSDPLFRDGHYCVIREKGKVVAGLQYYPITWVIKDFGGAFTNRVMKVLGKTAFVKRRANPDNFRLLAYDGLYCAPGKEDVLYELMEGVLAREKCYMALLEMDKESGLYSLLRRKKRFGLLYRIFGEFKARVMATFIRMPGEAVAEIKRKPFYIPTYDNS